MTDSANVLRVSNVASRRAEGAAVRRFQAVEWLQTIVGPLPISHQPSEKDFISFLRKGHVLCIAISKICPGAVPRVVEHILDLKQFGRYMHIYRHPWAYQYFQDARTFLVVVERLELPAIQASDLETDNLEPGSVAKVVDFIFALKAYHECKLMGGGDGFYKHIKTPANHNSAKKIHPRSMPNLSRHLDVSFVGDKHECRDDKTHTLEVVDEIDKLPADHILDSKENIDDNLTSLSNGSENSRRLFRKIISSFVNEKLEEKVPGLHSVFKDFPKEGNTPPSDLKAIPLEELPLHVEYQCCRSCLEKGTCNLKRLLKIQEKELADLKDLLSQTKQEFKDFQLQFQRDLKELGNLVQEMSAAALGYQKVVAENRKLCNMVQDLKGKGAARAYKKSGEIIRLQEQIENLKKALATKKLKSPSSNKNRKTEKGMNREGRKGVKTPSRISGT